MTENDRLPIGHPLRKHDGEDHEAYFIRIMNAVIVKGVLEGDWDLLATWIEEGYPITDKVRGLLVAILRGKVKKPRGGISTIKTMDEAMKRTLFFMARLDEGLGRERAVDETAAEFGTDRRTIQRNVKVYENVLRGLIDLFKAKEGRPTP
jgi:hypothetical protein